MLIRGDIGQTPADSFQDEDRDTGGGVNLFRRPSKASVTMSRPPGKDFDHYASPGWPSKHPVGPAQQRDRGGFYARHYSFGQEDGSFPSDPEKEEHPSPVAKTERQQYARSEQRTIVAKNLAERTTHKDIVEIVRGGVVLDIFLRANDRSASISFVEGAAAQNFMNHAKRNDIYIHGKRVRQIFGPYIFVLTHIQLEFAWNDRQFVLPGHVANKIGIGATRNLVIRGIHPNITEQRLRDDLDHIHNLIIINLFFRNGDAYLSLNSIHNSLFARTCMMSRAMYKGLRIEWYPDECAQPLLKTPYTPRKENPQRSVKKSNPVTNRFQMLNMDGTEDGTDDASEEEAGDIPSGLASFSPIGHRSPWNTRPVVA
jgi:hypothetical protein